MSLTGSTDAERIWNYLYAKIGNAYGTAGLMGNLYAESGLKPKNLQNSYEKSLGYTDDTYTAAVDAGTYTKFASDSAGYGLAQWTYSTRKKNMLAYHQAAGASIGDLETQLAFLVSEMQSSYSSVWKILKSATTVLEASNAVLTGFEKPANQGTSVQTARAKYGQKYYDKYAEEETEVATTKKVTQYAGIVKVSTYLKVRKGPGTKYDEYTVSGTKLRLPNGMVVSIEEEDADGNWGKLTNVDDAWISLSYITK